ncbi:MAG: hypothetical protein J5511_05475 [Bacilli bacterium]|nr:hypothetical protein [Bacilli bacterium]
MKIAAAVLSWIGGIATIGVLWGNCVQLIIYDTVWLILPLLFTLATIGTLIYRQWATNHGTKVLAGILTIIFCGLLGGIFTLCIPEEDLGGYTYQPKKNSYLSNPRPTSGTTVRRVEQVGIKPTSDNPVRVGDKIEIINGFFVNSIGKRVNTGTLTKAESVQGDKVSFFVSDGISTFSATTDMSNILIKERTPIPVEEKKEVKATPKTEEKPKVESTKQIDKFEEIKKYKELLDLDIITKEEFEAKKKELGI